MFLEPETANFTALETGAMIARDGDLAWHAQAGECIVFPNPAVKPGLRAGVLVIAQPGGGHIPLFGAAVALGAAFMIALISIQIRDLSRTDEPIAIVFWFSAWSSAVYALALPFFLSAHSPFQWALLLTIGVLGCAAQMLLTAALRFGQVASVIVMDYSSLIWATLYGWLVWDQLPPATTWLGAPLIIGAGALIAWREHRLSRAPSPLSSTATE